MLVKEADSSIAGEDIPTKLVRELWTSSSQELHGVVVRNLSLQVISGDARFAKGRCQPLR